MDQKIYEALKEQKRIQRIREWWYNLSFEAKWVLVIRFKNELYVIGADVTIGNITSYPHCNIDGFDNEIISRLYELDNKV